MSIDFINLKIKKQSFECALILQSCRLKEEVCFSKQKSSTWLTFNRFHCTQKTKVYKHLWIRPSLVHKSVWLWPFSLELGRRIQSSCVWSKRQKRYEDILHVSVSVHFCTVYDCFMSWFVCAVQMQQQELAQMRQREANLTALAAIGPRKKRRNLDSPSSSASAEVTLKTINLFSTFPAAAPTVYSGYLCVFVGTFVHRSHLILTEHKVYLISSCHWRPTPLRNLPVICAWKVLDDASHWVSLHSWSCQLTLMKMDQNKFRITLVSCSATVIIELWPVKENIFISITPMYLLTFCH